MPRPCSGNAPQNTPSAPVFTSTRAPNSFMISLQKRPVPATNQGRAAQAARRRAAALARSGARPCPVPKRANACASAESGTPQVGIEQPSIPHWSSDTPTPVSVSIVARTSRCTGWPAAT